MTTHHLSAEEVKQRNRFEGIFWAVALIWAGVVFWLDAIHWLPSIGGAGAWSWIFLGLGAYGMLAGIARRISPRLVDPVSKDFFWPSILLIIGLAGFTPWNITWPLIIILIGVGLLLNMLITAR